MKSLIALLIMFVSISARADNFMMGMAVGNSLANSSHKSISINSPPPPCLIDVTSFSSGTVFKINASFIASMREDTEHRLSNWTIDKLTWVELVNNDTFRVKESMQDIDNKTKSCRNPNAPNSSQKTVKDLKIEELKNQLQALSQEK